MSRVHIPDHVTEFPAMYVFRTYAPEIGAAAMNFSWTAYDNTCLTLREMEAARVRTAQINGCMVCQRTRALFDFDTHLPSNSAPFQRPMSARGPAGDDEFYASVAEWRNAKVFSARESLAIEFAERVGEQPHGLPGDDAFWARMRAHFDDREVVDLSLNIASWIGIGRVMHALQLDTVCLPTARAAAA